MDGRQRARFGHAPGSRHERVIARLPGLVDERLTLGAVRAPGPASELASAKFLLRLPRASGDRPCLPAPERP